MDLTKRVAYRNKKILDAANGEPCTICGAENGTTVFCHLNESWAGKAYSKKSDDLGMFLCSKCHDIYDGRIPGDMSYEDVLRAFYRTIRRLIDRKILK